MHPALGSISDLVCNYEKYCCWQSCACVISKSTLSSATVFNIAMEVNLKKVLEKVLGSCVINWKQSLQHCKWYTMGQYFNPTFITHFFHSKFTTMTKWISVCTDTDQQVVWLGSIIVFTT